MRRTKPPAMVVSNRWPENAPEPDRKCAERSHPRWLYGMNQPRISTVSPDERLCERADNSATQNAPNEATGDGRIEFTARPSQDRDSLPKRDFLDIMQHSPVNSGAAGRIERQSGPYLKRQCP